ncbi:TIGR00289 family protein [archaeon]|nr:TIGR00289 family protein [archaeon]
MRLAALFSGGKDSTFALYKAMKEGHEIKYLITVFPKRQDSWMFHYPCVELTKLQAKALDIKQIFRKTEGEKEKELDCLREVLKKLRKNIDGVISGALASHYQKYRIDKICEELGLKSLAPLWHKDQEEILREETSIFDVIIAGVAADGFDRSWLGRKIDRKTIDDLKKLKENFGINLCFEGGEAETLVLDGPIFKKKIEIRSFEKKWDNKTNSGYIEVKNARLVKK